MLNLEGRIGGDAELSHRGEEYARKLPELVRQSVGVSHDQTFRFWHRPHHGDSSTGVVPTWSFHPSFFIFFFPFFSLFFFILPACYLAPT